MKRIIPFLYKGFYAFIFLSFGFGYESVAQCLPSFGAASEFALFTGSGAVGNTATSVVTGDVGTNLGAITAFGSPTIVNGTIYTPDLLTAQAAIDLSAAYNQLSSIATTNASHAPAFGGGETLIPGVYAIAAAGSVGGVLYLDAQNDPNAIFIFKIGGAFTTGAGTTIVLQNQAKAGNVFWLSVGATTMAASTTIYGTIIAHEANSLGDLGVLNGRMYSIAGAISITGSTINAVGIKINNGGILSADQTIYSGTIPQDLTLSGTNGTVIKWQKSSDIDFTLPTDIINTTSLLEGNAIGVLNATTYFRAVVQKDSCPYAYSSVVKVTVDPVTIWNGTIWSNGFPDLNVGAIIEGVYSTSANGAFLAKKLTVNSGTLTVNSGTNITIQNEMVNTIGAGGIVIENNANLIQVNSSAVNTGSVTINRNSNALSRLDYTLWSSPVLGQNLLAFSPLTLVVVSPPSSRFYTYDSVSNSYSTVATPANAAFTSGSAYLIRMPNTAVTAPLTEVFNGQFTGVPNNGDVALTVTNGTYNAVGNPYPSTLSADAFITANGITEALYFWRKDNNIDQLTAPTTSYATYTFAGATGTLPTTLGGITPNGILQVGQGFIAKSTSATLVFTNSMRIANNEDQNLRTRITTERNRIWLNLTNPSGAFSQMMVAYMTGATQGVDSAIDGKYFNDCSTALNSLLNNEEFVIQGRALPFDETDVVPLAFKTNIAGDYSIGLDHFDGLFSGSQDIFLKDNATGIETDLKAGAYTFTAVAGVDNTRFSLKYQKTLKVEVPAFNDNCVTVYKNNETIHVKSSGSTIDNVKIYTISGRLIFEKSKVNANETTIENRKVGNQIVIVKITSQDDKVVSKKVVN